MSPPQTDTDIKYSSKATKILGREKPSRRSSTRDKGKSRGKQFTSRLGAIGRPAVSNGWTELTESSAVPDPYPLEDDLVMPDDSPTPAQERPESKRRKSKRGSVQPEEPITAPPSADDPVIVDPMDVEPAPVEAERRPRRERERERERELPRRERASSMAKDALPTLAGVAGTAAAVSGLKSMFAFGRKKSVATPDESPRDRRRAYETEDERRQRKRSTMRGELDDEEAKRLRHERRSLRRERDEGDYMASGANGNGNGNGNGSADYDAEREARRAERRARRERDGGDKSSRRAELEEVEAKAERRRERERENEAAILAQKKARQMAELERRNKQAEEELRRIAEKEERKRMRAERKMSTDDREHRSSRRKDSLRESVRPHNERRRSQQAETEEDRRRRHEERRAARRASEYPAPPNASGEPINDYFDTRNADPVRAKHRSSRRGDEEAQPQQPYLHKGPDKTSSWVQSLDEDNPLPPPIAETILDPPPGSREAEAVDEETPSQDEDIRLRIAGRRGPKRDKERAERHADRDRERERDKKQHRRRSYYEEEEEPPRSSKRDSRRKTYDQYNEQPVRTWDGRPEGETPRGVKRGSWLKKIAGLG